MKVGVGSMRPAWLRWREALSESLLELGLAAPLHIREEQLSRRSDAARLLYISDIHLRPRRSEHLIDQVVAAAQRSKPKTILLGGDMVDARTELPRLTELVGRLTAWCPVLAVAGNHDIRVGIRDVRDAVHRGGGIWIHDGAHRIPTVERSIVVKGPGCSETVHGDVRILCAHNPRVWKTAKHDNYDLVLAGHLHGCQFVAFECRERLYPGAVFYPYNYLTQQFGSTRLVVSRGVSDLVPIRWRCPREVVLCSV